MGKWRERRRARRLRRFHALCDRSGIPADVRTRILKITDRPPHWYAGRLQ